MNIVHIYELIEKINNKNLILYCEGIITTNIKIEKAQILKNNDSLDIYENTKEKVKINIHQIMKIEKISNKEYIIQFDGLQLIKVSFF